MFGCNIAACFFDFENLSLLVRGSDTKRMLNPCSY
jgi:hypothetical protein